MLLQSASLFGLWSVSFLIAGVVDRVTLDHRDFALADPVAIEVALEPASAADVLGAVLRILSVRLRLLLSECRCCQQRSAGSRGRDLLHELPPRNTTDAQGIDEFEI